MADDNISVPSLFAVNFIFISITCIYLSIKGLSNNTSASMLIAAYLIIVLSTQYLYNMWIILGTHKTSNTTMALSSMIFWIVFVIIYFIINMVFPVWKEPFSNTIGYHIVNTFYPVNDTLNQIMIEKEAASFMESAKPQGHVLTMANYENHRTFLEHLEKEGQISRQEDKWQILGNWYLYKDIVSEGVWLVLTGSLTIAVSYYFIVSSSISASPESIALLEAKRKAAEEDKNNEKSKPKFVTHSVGDYAPFNK